MLPDGRIHRLHLGPLCVSFREAPLTLTTLAALVPPELGADIRLADESVRPVPLDEPFDLVGVSCLTGTAPRAYAIADHFRARGATVVLGGVHVALRPSEAAGHADAIVKGFAERTWPALLRDYAAGRLQPVYEDDAPPLTGLPHARRDLQPRHAYAMPNTVFATRGCKGTCDFCTVPAVRFGWHVRPVAEVIDEVRSLRGQRFVFNDVNLFEDREYAAELLRGLVPLHRTWGGLASARIGRDAELLDLARESGCVYLLVGFESLSEQALQGIGKPFAAAADYPQVMQALHAHGIAVQGCFIFGLDSDGPEVFDATVQAVQDWRVDIPRYAIYTPYPGTRAFGRLQQEGRILHENWRYYDTQHVVFRPARMTPAELDAGFVRAYRETYRLRSILPRTAASPTPWITAVGNLAYRLYLRRLAAEPDRLPATGGPA